MTDTRYAYVGLGSNLGDRAGYLLLAVRGMMAAGLCVKRLSAIYETEAVGVPDEQPLYLNAVAELSLKETLFTPEQVLARLLRIEYALSRRRVRPLAARTIDLDLLLYADVSVQTDFLTLPHPRLHLRRFALAPLAELAPDLLHPTLGCSIADLLAATPACPAVDLWRPAGV